MHGVWMEGSIPKHYVMLEEQIKIIKGGQNRPKR